MLQVKSSRLTFVPTKDYICESGLLFCGLALQICNCYCRCAIISAIKFHFISQFRMFLNNNSLNKLIFCNMEEVGKRIKAIMAYYNIKYVKDFAVNTGISESSLSRQLNCKTAINYDTLLSILRSYPEISAEWLKAVSVAAGITKDISTHTGRHTFATTIAMSNGIPIEVISRMLGHSDIRTTQIYAKVQRLMIEEQGKIIEKKLSL